MGDDGGEPNWDWSGPTEISRIDSHVYSSQLYAAYAHASADPSSLLDEASLSSKHSTYGYYSKHNRTTLLQSTLDPLALAELASSSPNYKASDYFKSSTEPTSLAEMEFTER
jgi:hypothetical protein